MNIFKYILFVGFMGIWSFTYAEGGDDVGDDPQYNYNGIYISGGHPMGVRFLTAGAVCMFVEDMSCGVLPVADSLKSLDALAMGRVDMAVVQSDLLHHAVDGSSRFKQFGANSDLRVLAVLGVETVLVVVRKSANITRIADLQDRSFAIGVDTTYRSLFGKALLKSAGISQKSVNLVQTGVDESMEALCAGTADASIFLLSNPNGMMDTLTAQCDGDVMFLSLDTSITDKIQKSFKGTSVITLPSGVSGQSQPVHTVGFHTVLVTTAGLSNEKVMAVQSAMYDNLQSLQTLHPAFSIFSKDFITRDIGIPYYNAQ